MVAELFPLGNGDKRSRPKLKVIGVGGAGCNAVSNSSFESIGLCNYRDDVRGLMTHKKFVLSESHMQFVRGTSPRLMGVLDHECTRKLKETIGEADMIFVFAGLGGETGSFVAPGLAHLCRKLSDLVIVSAALPFSVEGAGRREVASRTLEDILDASHMTITYPNDGLLEVAPNVPLRKAFKVMDSIMMIPAVELSQVLTRDDLSLLRADLTAARHMRFGLGIGQGSRREEMAVSEAFSSPWFDFDLAKVRAAIVVLSGTDLDDYVIRTVIGDVSTRLPAARVRYAARVDPSIGDKLRVMVLLSADGH